MAKWEVIVYESQRKSVTVEADTREEAMNLGFFKIVNEPESVVIEITGGKTMDAYKLDNQLGEWLPISVGGHQHKQTKKGNTMAYDNPIDPKVTLKTQEGIKEFLEWLYDPEVDKAFEEFDKENKDKE